MFDDRRILRLAVRLRTAITENGVTHHRAQLPILIRGLQREWESLTRNLKSVAMAAGLGWHEASRSVLADGRFNREEVLNRVKELCDVAENLLNPSSCWTTVHALYDDLTELEEHFPTLKWDRNDLWVKTDPITLDGVYLGAFEIRLPIRVLGRLGNSDDFRVIALDPHPSEKREDVVHPHVEGTHLCTGEATDPGLLPTRGWHPAYLQRGLPLRPSRPMGWGILHRVLGLRLRGGWRRVLLLRPVFTGVLRLVHVQLFSLFQQPLPDLSGRVSLLRRVLLSFVHEALSGVRRGNVHSLSDNPQPRWSVP